MISNLVNLSGFTYIFFNFVIGIEQYPSIQEETTHRNLYSKNDNELISKIIEAESVYLPCNYQNCSCYENVINEDLLVFSNGITKSMIQEGKGRGVKYQLINHRLYRDSECLFPARCYGIEYFINQLRNDLDDFEVIINPRDWPQVSKFHIKTPIPVLSFSKTRDYFDIMYPAWSFWDGGPAMKLYPRGLGRWDQHRESMTSTESLWPWKKKYKKAFFRGSRTSAERDTLVLLSRQDSKIVDAAYTKNQAWRSNKDTLGSEPVDEVSLEDHCQYRYLFNFRGVAASFRLRHLFLCRSLVFHVGNDWLEFFYDKLKPWIHYIPIESGANENKYRSLLDFFMRHDEFAEKIAERGFKQVWDHLKMEDVLCYWKLLLTKYTKLLKFKPVLDQGLIDVTVEKL